jgi:hypothetical protein
MTMRRGLTFTLVLAAVLSAAGCGVGYKEGSRQPDSQSFIVFTGNVEGAMASVDEGEPFAVASLTYKDASGNDVKKAEKTFYQVRPGRHTVVVKKMGEVRVEREILIDAGATKEVWVP